MSRFRHIAALLLSIVLLGCDSSFVEDLKSITVVVEAVAELANTDGVHVSVRDGLEMSVVVSDAPINTASEDERRALADRIALLGLEHYAHADELQAMSVEFIATERKYLIVTLRSTTGFYRYTRSRLESLQRAARATGPLQRRVDES